MRNIPDVQEYVVYLWDCPACGETNDSTNVRCEQCGQKMAGPHVREGVREVIEEAYWKKVGIVGGTLSLHLMFKELQEGHVK